MTSADNSPPAGPAGKLVDWLAALQVYLKPRVVVMLFLGFSAGLPLLLVFGTLSAWLAKLGVSKTGIGFFSWVGITYSLKFIWAPVIDRLSLPVLTKVLGKRRSWMLVGQAGIICGLIAISFSDPASDLVSVALIALLIAFSSATQDIVIDAYRIESAPDDLQGAMAANYILGYRLGMIVAGAGALYIAGSVSWPAAYQAMAVCMAIGVATTFYITEPEHAPAPELDKNLGESERRKVAYNIFGIATLFATVAGIVLVLPYTELVRPLNSLTHGIFVGVLVLAAGLAALGFMARSGNAQSVVGWTYPSIILPFADFFQRLGWLSIVILAFIATYRFSDIMLGIMANPFYIDLGFNEKDIASVTKVFGLIMTILGGYAGGLLITRRGIGGPLLLGACLVAATNLLFAWLATVGPDINALAITIAADNFSGGLAGAALIAYASSLTNRTFSASQYAIFSSLFTLMGKFIGGFSGIVVDGYGYFTFFGVAAALGVPAIVLTLYLMRTIPKRPAGDLNDSVTVT
ncbi:MAG: MFS transporter [Rhizobiales bacterium]|nr:MFS transporter [Hyphomicrobiales bacterium]